MPNNNIGSEWRIWDLQVQTILDDGYESIESYINEIKASSPIQYAEFLSVMGSEDNIKKYDNKNYFFTGAGTGDDEKLRSTNYARLFANYIDIFNPDGGAICVTDHNYQHNHLIDELVKASALKKVKIIPGVEINVQGVHMLVLFGSKPYNQSSYSLGIKLFLSQLNIHNPKDTGGVLTVCNKSYTDVIQEIDRCEGILIYPHCNSSNGLFQERGKTDRTHLKDQFNYKNPILLQAQDKETADKTIAYIGTKLDVFTVKYGMTLGSDARSLRKILKSDSNGNYCWIKADATFEGLKRVTHEPIERIFLGIRPEVLERVAHTRTEYIKELHLKQIPGYSGAQGEWFLDVKIPFNPGLTAIIGNKGSGKSAIADIIGLVGNSHKDESKFSFLNKERFKRKNLAKNFEGSILWESGDTDNRNLGETVDYNSPEKVRYIPQRYFEEITNEQDSINFQHTLEGVVFGYIPLHERDGTNSFEELINKKRSFIEKRIESLREDLAIINYRIAQGEIKKEPAFKEGLVNKCLDIEKQIKDQENQIKIFQEANKDIYPKEGASDQKNSEEMEKIGGLEIDIGKLNEVIEDKQQKYKNLIEKKSKLDALIKAIEFLEHQIESFKDKQKDAFHEVGYDVNKIITYSTDTSKIKEEIVKIEAEATDAFQEICDPNDILMREFPDPQYKDELLKKNLFFQREGLNQQIQEIKKGLTEKEQKIHEFEKNIKAFNNKKKILEGDANTPDTRLYYLEQIKYLESHIDVDLGLLYSERIGITKKVFQEYILLLREYEKIKKFIDIKIGEFQHPSDGDRINIDVGIILERDFGKEFTDFILKNKKGTFSGNENAELQLRNIIQDRDLNNIDEVIGILNIIIDYLREDKREEVKEEDKMRFIREQISDVNKFYDYIFGLSYLGIKYDLSVGAKKINELSPGERGTLLLVFYLMIDNETIPLVIDQPEDNLDNESVYHKLSSFIREAKKKRQIIIVTHNPNLAIGADAENIIQVHIDKVSNHSFTHKSGAIENPEMNSIIVKILEGTMIAFQGRDKSYIRG